MRQSIIHVALVVRDYDEAIAFFCNKLHFTLIEDTYQPEQDKRWVIVAPPGGGGASLVLARASTAEQVAWIGAQSGGRVFLFLATDDFWHDYNAMREAGIHFVREPKEVQPTELWRSFTICMAISGISSVDLNNQTSTSGT